MKLHKTVCLGTIPVSGVNRSVFCDVNLDEKGTLAIRGVVGPRKGGEAWGYAGQIQDDLEGLVPGAGWTQEMVDEFLNIWRKWHLNDMQPGTRHQMDFLREWRKGREILSYDYEDECKALAEAGLLEDSQYLVDGKPYRYGSSYLKFDLPAEVIAFLRGIPVSLKEPVWV